MCAIGEEALANAGILTPGAKSPSVARDARASLLSETLELLNQLPFRGFPDEHQVRVPVFSLQDGAVMARTSPLRKLPGNFRIQSELRSVRQGGTYKMPYRSEEHTSELQSLMRISYAVFCLKKKTKEHINYPSHILHAQHHS